MANTNDPGRARPGRLRRLGGWLLVVLAMPGIAAVVETAFADPDTPTDGEERPFAQVARDELHSPVWALAFSPDGSRLASSTISGDVWLFDKAHGLRTPVAHGRADFVRSLAFSPDGRILAIGTPGRVVRLVDASSASELGPVESDGGDDAPYVAISPDGRYLAAGGSGATVTIWDWVSRKRLGALAGARQRHGPGFAPDGATLAVGDVTGRVRLWAIPAGVERLTLVADAPRHGVTSLAFSPDGTSLAAASKLDRCVRLWDRSDGRPRGAIPSTPAYVQAVAYSPDGALLAIAQADGGATLWGVAEGRELARVRANGQGLQSVAFSADGRSFVTGGNDGRVRVWDVARAIAGR